MILETLETSKFEQTSLDTVLGYLSALSSSISGRTGKYLPFNKVDTRGRLNNAADLAWLQRKGGILEFLLHLATAEKPACEELVLDIAKDGIAMTLDVTYRSPFFLALLQSDSETAISPKLTSPERMRCS